MGSNRPTGKQEGGSGQQAEPSESRRRMQAWIEAAAERPLMAFFKVLAAASFVFWGVVAYEELWAPRWMLMQDGSGGEFLALRQPHRCELPEAAIEQKRWGMLFADFGASLAYFGEAQWREGGDRIGRISRVAADQGHLWLATWWDPREGRAASGLFQPSDWTVPGPAPVALLGSGTGAAGEGSAEDVERLRAHQAETLRIGRQAVQPPVSCEGALRLAARLRDLPGP